MAEQVVIEHVHDEATGLYRLSFGVSVDTGDEDVVVYEDIREIVWADDDRQWFDDAGERRDAADVAAEQRAIAAVLLASQAADGAAGSDLPTPLPGVGEAL